MSIDELVPKSDENWRNCFAQELYEYNRLLVRTNHKFDCVSQTYDNLASQSEAIDKLKSICPI